MLSVRASHRLLKNCIFLRSGYHLLASDTNTIPKPRKNQVSDCNNSGLISLNIHCCYSGFSSRGQCQNIQEAARDWCDVACSSTIIHNLKNGDLAKAEMLFQKVPERNVVVESAMVNAYAKAGRIYEARKLFDEMPVRNVFTWTSLISGYCQVGWIEEACRLFKEMPIKNVVSWTTMMLGYARNGLILDARDLFDRMPEKNVVSWTAMIKSYIVNDQIDKARNLFDEMPRRNLYSWNIMILGYLDNKLASEAINLFQLMPQRNVVSWTTMVTGLAHNGLTEEAQAFFDQMPKKDIAAWNAMITAYTNDGLMTEASDLFNLMPERNVVTWNALIDGYVKNGLQDEALKHLLLMLLTSTKPNETTLTSGLVACESITEVMQIHAMATRLGFVCDTSFTNALVTMYSRIGDLGSAHLAFEKLMAKDVISWTTMILAYSYHGCGEYALQVFARMLKFGAHPDEITFVGLLSACSHGGLVEKGKRLFDSMNQAYGLEPEAEHYACLVDMLGRAGRVDEATRVVRQMPLSERDGAVLGALLGACRVHGEIRLASRVGEELIELDRAGSGGYVLLANAYASNKQWDDVARVRKMMKERKVKKVAGFSQIEVKMRNHVFYVGDRSHSHSKEIYQMLEQGLFPQMMDMGYLQRIHLREL